MFQPGDLVFQATAGVQNVFAEHVNHVMICIDPKPHPRFAHVSFNGARIGTFDPVKFRKVGAQLRGFGCTNPDLARSAVSFARAWAVSSKEAATTAYSMAQGEIKNRIKMETVDPGFGADAVRRAFKWATRAEAPLSRIRESPQTPGGVTCPTFVVACYQAAALNLNLDPSTLKEVAAELDALQFKRDPAEMKKLFGAYPEDWKTSIPGVHGIPAKIWGTKIGQATKYFDESFFKEILPESLVVDAKWVSAQVLYARVLKDPRFKPVSGWIELADEHVGAPPSAPGAESTSTSSGVETGLTNMN